MATNKSVSFSKVENGFVVRVTSTNQKGDWKEQTFVAKTATETQALINKHSGMKVKK